MTYRERGLVARKIFQWRRDIRNSLRKNQFSARMQTFSCPVLSAVASKRLASPSRDRSDHVERD